MISSLIIYKSRLSLFLLEKFLNPKRYLRLLIHPWSYESFFSKREVEARCLCSSFNCDRGAVMKIIIYLLYLLVLVCYTHLCYGFLYVAWFLCHCYFSHFGNVLFLQLFYKEFEE